MPLITRVNSTLFCNEAVARALYEAAPDPSFEHPGAYHPWERCARQREVREEAINLLQVLVMRGVISRARGSIQVRPEQMCAAHWASAYFVATTAEVAGMDAELQWKFWGGQSELIRSHNTQLMQMVLDRLMQDGALLP